MTFWYPKPHIDGLEQDCSNPIANALELLQSCTKLSIWRLTPPASGWDNIIRILTLSASGCISYNFFCHFLAIRKCLHLCHNFCSILIFQDGTLGLRTIIVIHRECLCGCCGEPFESGFNLDDCWDGGGTSGRHGNQRAGRRSRTSHRRGGARRAWAFRLEQKDVCKLILTNSPWEIPMKILVLTLKSLI